ncbi:MAG TPA: redoxin domain-containing protein [Dehalococcoidia bacterium]|nr:thiol:disulfide interchange protein [Dehalococcoidia bacterium]MQG30239.1 redoxin domain-containing protein [SAR202 cluster bacterium]HIM60647.1 redoxin domain-containing protein [Dehalococcoidia bacterium]
MGQRRSVLIGVGVPVLLVLSLFVWGVAQNDGVAGRPGVNDNFGEVSISTDPMSDFELTTLSGEVVSIADYRGKVVMVDFWSSWCVPCRVEGPILSETYLKWRDRGVEFVGIAIWDSEGPVLDFIELHGIEYVNAIDASGLTAVDFGVTGIPEKFFINTEGEIVRKVIGPNTRETLDSILTDLTDDALGVTR